MNNKLIIPIILVLLLVGLGGYYASTKKSGSDEMMSKSSDSMAIDDNTNMENGDEEYEDINTSLMDLLNLGKSYTCTYSYDDASGMNTEGLVYVSGQGDKVSGDFTVEMSDGQNITSNFISDGEYSYIWSSAMEKGFKTKISHDENSGIFTTPSAGEKEGDSNSGMSFDEMEKIDYKCKPWRVDDSKFSPPSNVEFMDFSAMMESNEMSPTGNESMDKCAACEYMPDGDSKVQCMQALDC